MDILIVRELISDVYFGEPRGFDSNKDGSYAFNTMKYTEKEVSRISDFAFSIASNSIFDLSPKSLVKPF